LHLGVERERFDGQVAISAQAADRLAEVGVCRHGWPRARDVG